MATMKNLVDKLEQQSEVLEELNEKIQLLFGLCIEKMSEYEEKLKCFLKDANAINGLSFPISSIGSVEKNYRFILPTTESYLVPYIQYCIDDIFKKNIDDEVRYDLALTINKLLEQLLSIAPGTEQHVQGYTVATEGIMNLVRIDYIIWCRKSSVGMLGKEVKCAIGAVAIKSNIDVSQTNFNDFCSVYQRVIMDGLPEGISMVEKTKLLVETIQCARQIFIAMGGKETNRILKNSLVEKSDLVKFSEVSNVTRKI